MHTKGDSLLGESLTDRMYVQAAPGTWGVAGGCSGADDGECSEGDEAAGLQGDAEGGHGRRPGRPGPPLRHHPRHRQGPTHDEPLLHKEIHV